MRVMCVLWIPTRRYFFTTDTPCCSCIALGCVHCFSLQTATASDCLRPQILSLQTAEKALIQNPTSCRTPLTKAKVSTQLRVFQPTQADPDVLQLNAGVQSLCLNTSYVNMHLVAWFKCPFPQSAMCLPVQFMKLYGSRAHVAWCLQTKPSLHDVCALSITCMTRC